MATLLFKTEPSEFSYDDLAKTKSAVWDGVSNAQALANLRRAAPGDEVLIYETGNRKAIVGLAQIASKPRDDPKQPGLNAQGEIRTPVVDVKAIKRVPTEVTLEQIKSDGRFAELALVRQPRLSIMLLPEDSAKALKEMCGLDTGSRPSARGTKKK